MDTTLFNLPFVGGSATWGYINEEGERIYHDYNVIDIINNGKVIVLKNCYGVIEYWGMDINRFGNVRWAKMIKSGTRFKWECSIKRYRDFKVFRFEELPFEFSEVN